MSFPSSYLPYGENARQPRAIVTINGVQVNWTRIEVTTTTFYQADNYRIELPLNNQPAGFDLNYWSGASPLSIYIYIGFPPDPNYFSTNDLDLMIVGDVDELDVDPLTTNITIGGRDLTSRFIDNKTTQKFSNSTSSAVATFLAQENGLTPQVTETFTRVGTFYQTNQTLLTRAYTQWDLLTFLAQQEDFVVFVQNTNLIFEPRPTTSQNPFILQYQPPTFESPSPIFNGMQLGFSRSMTISNDVIVKVRVPYGTKTGTAFSVTARATHRPRTYISGAPRPSSTPQKYSYTIAGLSREQAQQKANSLLRDITQHEVRLTAMLPGENTLKKDSLLQVKGTNSAFDHIYYSESIERRISIEEGYVMTISAKNHSVDSEVNL